MCNVDNNVPADVGLSDTFNLSETTLLSFFFSNAMHACIYVHITVRLFPCLYISYMFRGPYGRLAVELNMSPS